MAEIRRIPGVTDVRTVLWMPSEREHRALSAVLEALPEPVLSLDMKGKIELANPASCQLFALTRANCAITTRYSSFPVSISRAGWKATRTTLIANMLPLMGKIS